ncbi:MAG: TetR/AcrR family transcriptional regulator [Myxococcota bacterium]
MHARKKRPFAFKAPPAKDLSPRKEATQARAKATIGAIHEAALQVLTDIGFDKLTTTRVAERAGVSVGTLYQYYGDKNALGRALIVEYLGRIEEGLRGVLEEPRDPKTLARHLVRRFIAFKLEERPRSLALRTVMVHANAQEVLQVAMVAIIAALEVPLAAAYPRWPKGRAHEVATIWATLVAGATSEMLDRSPDTVAEPWFGEALEAALIAQL